MPKAVDPDKAVANRARSNIRRLLFNVSDSDYNNIVGRKIFEESAENGNSYAQQCLGEWFYNGTGVFPKDRDLSFYWYRKAAENGENESQFRISNMYFTGYGIEKDPRKGFMWCKKAAEQGYQEAQYSLGVYYHLGLGTISNKIKAYAWTLVAASRGYFRAQHNKVAYESILTRGEIAKGRELARTILRK